MDTTSVLWKKKHYWDDITISEKVIFLLVMGISEIGVDTIAESIFFIKLTKPDKLICGFVVNEEIYPTYLNYCVKNVFLDKERSN